MTPFRTLVFSFIRAFSTVMIYYFNIEFYTRQTHDIYDVRCDN